QLADLKRDNEQRLTLAKNELASCSGDKTRLSAELAGLQQQSNSQGQQLQALNTELESSKRAVADLSKQVVARGQILRQPEAVLEMARSAQVKAAEQGAPAIASYEEDGRIHEIRELVIGTLEISYEKEQKANEKFPLKATFTPHPIISPGTLKT